VEEVRANFDQYGDAVGFNRTHWDWKGEAVPFTALVEPCTLHSVVQVNGVSPSTCQLIIPKYGDPNIKEAIFTSEFLLPESVTGTTVKVAIGDRWHSTLSTHRLNALETYQFVRPLPASLTESSPNMKVAVCIKPVYGFQGFVRDIVEYYEQEGFSHVYIGLQLIPGSHVVQQYAKALAPWIAKRFVSLGWVEPESMLWLADPSKIPFINSVLFHSKSYDTGLMVNDLDEVMVSMDPKKCTAPDALWSHSLGEPLDKVCNVELQSHALPQAADSAATTLHEKFPTRCNGGTANYVKSVAIVKNADWVGLHGHDSCRGGTKKVKANPSISTIHHYTALFEQRWNDKGCDIRSEFAVARALHLGPTINRTGICPSTGVKHPEASKPQ